MAPVPNPYTSDLLPGRAVTVGRLAGVLGVTPGRWVGGDPLSPRVVDRLRERFGQVQLRELLAGG